MGKENYSSLESFMRIFRILGKISLVVGVACLVGGLVFGLSAFLCGLICTLSGLFMLVGIQVVYLLLDIEKHLRQINRKTPWPEDLDIEKSELDTPFKSPGELLLNKSGYSFFKR